MTQNLKQDLVHYWRNKNIIFDERVIAAFETIPREIFLPEELQEVAYHDHPLPTLREQSISQPTTIMIMLQALEVQEGDSVLEIGSGVGYQAALLSCLVTTGSVVTMEIIPELIQASTIHLQQLGITNVSVIESDGSRGFPEKAPFDKIILTAACPTIPKPLLDQLKIGGTIIAPVGDVESQTMVKGIKKEKGLDLDFLGNFRFVPLRGKYGFKD